MTTEHKSPSTCEPSAATEESAALLGCNHSSSSALGLSRLPRSLWLFVQCRTSRKRKQGWGGKSPSEKRVLFTQGSQGSYFVTKGKSHLWHLQSPSNRCISCRDTFAMEIWFGLELNQFKEGTGRNASHKYPTSRVPCRATPAPGGVCMFPLGPTCHS